MLKESTADGCARSGAHCCCYVCCCSGYGCGCGCGWGCDYGCGSTLRASQLCCRRPVVLLPPGPAVTLYATRGPAMSSSYRCPAVFSPAPRRTMVYAAPCPAVSSQTPHLAVPLYAVHGTQRSAPPCPHRIVARRWRMWPCPRRRRARLPLYTAQRQAVISL